MSLRRRMSMRLAAVALAVAAFVPATPATAASRLPASHAAHDVASSAGAHVAIPGSQGSALQREVMGFVNSGNLTDPNFGYPSWNMRLLSTVVYFGVTVQPGDGSINTAEGGWTTLNSAAMANFVNYAHSYGVRVIVSFNARGDVCGQLLPSNQQTTVNIAVQQVQQHHLDGISIDYEGNDVTCSNTNVRARDELVSFLQRLRSALPNAYLSIDTYTGSAEDNLEFFNVTGLAPSVDSFFVMAYAMDFANYNEPPLNCSTFCFNPMSPLNTYRFNVTSSMAQYSALVPASKVILGQPLYGRRGCVPNLTDAHQNPTTSAYPYFATPTYYYLTHLTGYTSFTTHRDPGDGVSEWVTFYDTDIAWNREQYWDDVGSLGSKFDLVNRDNIGGVGFFTLDYAGRAPEVRSSIATHFTLIPGLPGNVAACAGNGSATVSWTAAPTAGGPVTSYQVSAQPGGASVTVPATATIATVTGLTPGQAYTLTVQAINSSGPGVGGTVDNVAPVSTPPSSTSYYAWYDRSSPGALYDTIHVTNTGAATSTGCVTVPGSATVPFSVDGGKDSYVWLPPGTIGGPVLVTVNSGPPIISTSRSWFNQSLSEIWARPAAAAATTQYFPWYDLASPGMRAETIHITNINTSTATGTIALPGAPTITFSVDAGRDAYFSFPGGTIGGPVTISSAQPVLATMRAWYYGSLSESPAQPAANAATTLYLAWYDLASPGIRADTIHITDVGASAASGTVSLPGAKSLAFNVGSGQDTYVAFPGGTIGGPVTIASNQPVVAELRGWYNQSLSETSARPASEIGRAHV